jgi:dimeric dUTPase (all-alpha-NTP-PPase superfamily)
MNIAKLFEMQRKLDEHIMTEHPELRGQDNLPWKILALLVEIGELANEWRGFKKWSRDQKPRTKVLVKDWFEGLQHHQEFKNPLLEEFADGLSFILSIGLELNIEDGEVVIDSDYTEENGVDTFNKLFETITDLRHMIEYSAYVDVVDQYEIMFNLFVGLGEKFLGFTQEQIEQAYFRKNKINHERQVQGY